MKLSRAGMIRTFSKRAKGNRVLLFRLSEAQVQTREREEECEKTLRGKIKGLSS